MLVIALTVVVAVLLVQTGIVEMILRELDGGIWAANFLGGFFFTSIFTTAIAVVVLGEIAQEQSVLLTAVIGGVGAMIGDFVIFRFMRDHFAADLDGFLKARRLRRWKLLIHGRYFRWFFLLIGAVIIASPLPDELGLTLMGLSRMRISTFLLISFVMNSLGIFVIGLVARSFI